MRDALLYLLGAVLATAFAVAWSASARGRRPTSTIADSAVLVGATVVG